MLLRNRLIRDFLKMEQTYPEVFGKKAEEIMVRNPLTVAPERSILEAASYMDPKNFSRLRKNSVCGSTGSPRTGKLLDCQHCPHLP